MVNAKDKSNQIFIKPPDREWSLDPWSTVRVRYAMGNIFGGVVLAKGITVSKREHNRDWKSLDEKVVVKRILMKVVIKITFSTIYI